MREALSRVVGTTGLFEPTFITLPTPLGPVGELRCSYEGRSVVASAACPSSAIVYQWQSVGFPGRLRRSTK